MGQLAQGRRVGTDLTPRATEQPRPAFIWGPLTGLGICAALAALVIDQAVKLWLLNVYDIESNGAFAVTPFFDVVEVWNKGISYGLFWQESELGQWALLALKIVAVVLLWIWLSRITIRLSALSLGLIIGGAIGNAIDRVAYGAVFDFAHFHITTSGWNFSWYVFNLADVAIVVGVAGLLYDSLFGDHAVKAP